MKSAHEATTLSPVGGSDAWGLCGSKFRHTDGVATCIKRDDHDGWHFDVCMVCLEDGFDVPLYWDDDGNAG